MGWLAVRVRMQSIEQVDSASDANKSLKFSCIDFKKPNQVGTSFYTFQSFNKLI